MPHQHCILADRRASAVALGKDSNDDSVGDLLAGNRAVGGTRSQHPLKHFLLEILDNKARRFYSMSNPPGLFVQPRCCD